MAVDVRSYGAGRSSGLFRGQSDGRMLGAQLTMMLHGGQTIIKQERTRWQFNRSMYRGQQYIRASGSTLRSLAPAHRLPSGKRRDVVNRSRSFIDGRSAMLTMRTPAMEVPVERNTRQAFQSAKLAERIVNFYWNQLDLSAKFRAMIRTGDVDGPAFLCVYFDPDMGEQVSLPFTQDGQPIADPGMLDAMDAMGTSAWKEMSRIGDICVRNVPIGRLSIDPLAREVFTDARWVIETRIRPREDVEREIGMPIDEWLKRAGQGAGENRYPYVSPMPDLSRLSVDEFDEVESAVSGRDYIKQHELFHKATGERGDWPMGAHIRWIDQAPQVPTTAEEWADDLPYVCYIPRPDDGHFLRAKAIMDDLAPLNIALNRAVSQYHEMLDLYARAPILAQRGSLVSKYIYNERRIVEYNAGYQPPQWMKPPPEPSRILENIEFLLSQMAEIAIQNDVSRGTPPGQGIDAGVSLHYLGQQNEQQMAGLEKAVKRAIEDTCTKILRNICRYFTVPRMLAIPGVYGVEQINNFTGQMLRGCNRVRVTGSLLPRNQAAQMQTMIQLGSNGLFDPRPYVAQLVEGRMEEITSDLERHEREQRNECRDMDLLGSIPNIDAIWQQFQQMRAEHAAMVAMYQQAFAAQEQAMLEAGDDPTGLGDLMPQLPPAPVLANIGIEVPTPNEWNDDAVHLAELDRRRTEEGYIDMHPLVRQAYHEHADMHKQKLAAQLDALRPQPANPDQQLAEMVAGSEQGAPDATGAGAPPAAPATPVSASPPSSAPAGEPTQVSMGPEEAQTADNGDTTFTAQPTMTPKLEVRFDKDAIRFEPNITVDAPTIPPIKIPPVVVPPIKVPETHVTVVHECDPPAPAPAPAPEPKVESAPVELTEVEYDEKGRIKHAKLSRVKE